MAQTWTAEIMGGTAVNFTTPLIVHQAGYPNVDAAAHYDTRPFGPDFPYYAFRFSRWSGDEAWEFGQVHHRLFLADPPAGIQYFAIHYGYSYLLFGHAWRRGEFVYHAGIGPIVTNPATTVHHENRSVGGWLFNGGYYTSGIGMGVSAERDFRVTTRTFAVVELELTAGNAWDVPIANGSAEVPNIALHFHIGLGRKL